MEAPYSCDLRAAATASKRARTRAEKYYSFRFVKPGQINQPHYRLVDSQHAFRFPDSGLYLSQSTHTNFTPIENISPRVLYEEAQCWPRPPRYHHRHTDKLDKRGAVMSYEKRRMDQREIKITVEGSYVLDDISSDDVDRQLLYNPLRVCNICEIGEGHNDGRDVREAAKLAETLASHRRCGIEALVAGAEERWEGEQRIQVGNDGWSVLSCSDEDSDCTTQHSESSAGWEIVNS
ncbi:MAG: hypothetical protein Q9195_008496 [Heterodermia aff. obscurata]